MARSQNSFIKKKKAEEKKKKKAEKLANKIERNKEKGNKSDNWTAEDSFNKMMLDEEEANKLRQIQEKKNKSASQNEAQNTKT